MSQAKIIKDKIETVLNTLVPATLGSVLVQGIRDDIFDKNISAYPVAVLPPPYITGDTFTNAENMRTYNFEILIIWKEDDGNSSTPIEDLMETLMDTFDNMPSLEGVANAGLEPATSPTEVVTHRGATYTVFRVILKAKATTTIDL